MEILSSGTDGISAFTHSPSVPGAFASWCLLLVRVVLARQAQLF